MVAYDSYYQCKPLGYAPDSLRPPYNFIAKGDFRDSAVKLEGQLSTFPLRELIEMVMYSSVTGMLEVYTNNGPGRLFFQDGRPHHAAINDKVGVAATHELFFDPQARFLFVSGIENNEETVWMDPIELLDSCEAMAQRVGQIKATVPSFEWVPTIIQTATKPVNVAEDDWALLTLIDGVRSVDDIATELFAHVVDIAESLQRMASRGQIALRPPHGARPVGQPLLASLGVGSAAPSSEQPRNGLLDRFLGSSPSDEPLPLGELPLPPAYVEEDPIVKLLRNA
jgi:hypothetical protein